MWKAELQTMNLTIEILEGHAARFQKQAEARGLTVDRRLLELAEQNAPALPGEVPPKPNFDRGIREGERSGRLSGFRP